MTITITRIDVKNSYQTLFQLFNDETNETQEISVPCWNAKANESELKKLDWTKLSKMHAKSGETSVKPSNN